MFEKMLKPHYKYEKSNVNGVIVYAPDDWNLFLNMICYIYISYILSRALCRKNLPVAIFLPVEVLSVKKTSPVMPIYMA